MCRDRGVEFTEIDLRWGLNQEDSEKGRIIGTCLEEIDECRPFFVGLLGERYGWVPPMEELEKNEELRKAHPWLEDAVASGQSMTEMEFRHGFLNHASLPAKPMVYFRSLPDAPPEDERVTRLKQEVSMRLGEIPAFSTPSELASLIEKDLFFLIENYWPSADKVSWLEEERAGHAAFAQSRRKGYVANPSVIDSLNEHIEKLEPVIVITGESGAGKSSLLAYWAESLRQRDPNLFIVEHYIGVTSASTDPDTLMRRIVEEIKERTHTGDAVPQSAAELEQAFPSWLGRIAGERMLILVDAINQLNTDGRFLGWLPEHVQSNIRWVISSTQSEALDRLRDRGRLLDLPLPEIAVLPISLPERRRVLRTFLAGYQKKLDRKQEEKIVRSKKSASPLFLRTLLEELRLQGKHEELDHHIAHYLESSDIPDLFGRILERIEFDYGASEVETLLTRIWAAPHGLSESEIIESSDLDRAALSLLLHAFDFHLIRVKGRLSFFHDHLRQAVELRYLDQSLKKEEAWMQVAEYFQTTEPSSIKAVSLPWLLSKAERWHLLKEALLDISLLPYLTEGSRSYDLLAYWNALEKREASVAGPNAGKKHWNIDVVSEYESSLAHHPENLDASNECKIRYALGLFFRNAGWFEGAISNEAQALALLERQVGEIDDLQFRDPAAFSFIIDICNELGKGYLDKGDLKNAAEVLEKALRLLGDYSVSNHANMETNIGNDLSPSRSFDVRHINIRNEYARLLKDQGKYADAERISQVTLKAATERFGTAHFTTQNEMRWLADIMWRQGKFAEAESLYRAVINSVEASLGPESLDIAYYLNEFVQFLRIKGLRTQVSPQVEIVSVADDDYKEAEQISERAVAIIENRLGKNHHDLGMLLNNLASLHSQNGNWEKAEPLFLRSLAIDEVAYGPEHTETARGLINYAVMLFRQGKYDLAEEPYRRALAIWRKALGENHPETAACYNNLANLLRRQEKYEEAEECYAQALRIRLATIGPLHVDTSRTLEGYGRFMRIQGNLASAEDFLNRSYAARKECLGPKHHDTIFVALELAEVLLELSKAESAQSIVADTLISVGAVDAIPDDLKQKYENLAKRL